MINPLLGIWQRGDAVVNSWLHLPLSYTAEIFSRIGFDSVTCDMQHGLVDYNALFGMFTAISTSTAVPMTRVPGLDKAIIGRALDAGALGIICPMINTISDAEGLVSACRYAPQGQRSFGPNRATFFGADYVKNANDMIVPFAMIETQEALDNLEGILSVDGLKAVYIGPVDLSISLGCEPKIDPTDKKVIDAIEYILELCKDKGVIAGIHTGSSAGALKMINKGFQFVSLPSDRILLENAAKKIHSEVRLNQKGKDQ